MSFRGRNLQLMPTGGVDDSQGAQNIGDNNVAAAQNVRFFFNDWRQRGGTAPKVTARAAAAAITGIRSAIYSTGVSRFVATCNQDIFKQTGAASWASIKGALTFTGGANDLFAFCEINDVTVGTNGLDQLFCFSDATDPAVALSGSPPAKAHAMMAFHNRLIVGEGSQVTWSSINNINDWTSTSSGSATPLQKPGMNITGIASVGSDAFVFYDRKIQSMQSTGDDHAPFIFAEHDEFVGASCQQSIIGVPEERLLFFANAQGIWMMSGAAGYVPQRISKSFQGSWNTINKTRANKIIAGRLVNFTEVWFAVSLGSGSTNSIVFVYDYGRQVWNGSFVIAANAFGSYIDANGDERLAFGDYNGFVNDTETGNRDLIPVNATPTGVPTAIDAFVTSKDMRLVDGRRRSSVWEAELEIDGQSSGSTLEFNFGYDMQGITTFLTLSQAVQGAQWGAAVWGVDVWPNAGRIRKLIKPGRNGKDFQFQIRNRQINNTFRVYGVNLGLVDENSPEEAAA